MSHHGLDLLPGVIPLGRPAKLNKKRRLRKARAGEVAYTQEIDGLSGIDQIFVMDEEDGETLSYDAADENGSAQAALSWFSTGTMQTLLRVQEDK